MKKLLGAVAGLALLGFTGGANAQGMDQGSDSYNPSAGGSGTTSRGMQQPSMGMQSIEGRVLKAERSSITIESQGAAIPLEVKRDTTFQGTGVRAAKDVKEGQQVRASFEMKNNKNELKSLEVLGGAGGSGMQQPGTRSKSGSGTNY
jgi:hypothetical protein